MRRLKALFSLGGRTPRSTFVASSLLSGLAFAALHVLVESLVSRAATLALAPLLLFALFALSTRRLHDRGRSAWRLLLLLVPVAGPLWLFVELVLLPGTAGENRYGPDPLAPTGDYLVVR